MDKKKKILDLRELLNKQKDATQIVPRTVVKESVTKARKLPKQEVLRVAAPAVNTEIDVAEAKGDLTPESANNARMIVNSDDKTAKKIRKKDGIASKFADGLALFAPDLIGLAVGGLLGGTEGAVEGLAQGQKVRKDVSDARQQKFENEQANIKTQLLEQGQNAKDRNADASLLTAQTNAEKFKSKQAQDLKEANTPSIDTDFIIASNPTVSPERRGEQLFDPTTGQEISNADIRPIDAVAEARKNQLGGARIGISASSLGLRKDKFANQIEEQTESDNLALAKSFDNDPEVRNIREADRMIAPALAALDSGSPMAPGIAANALARLNGEKGPLTESDLSRFGGRQDIASKLKRVTAKQKTGAPLTGQDKEDFKFLLKVMDDINKQRINSIKTRKVKTFSRATKDVTVESGNNILDVKETPRQRLERLRKAKAGK